MLNRLPALRWWKKPPLPPGLLAPGTRLEKLASGFRFVEGPLWLAEENCLLFSDIPANRIYRWSAQNGVEVFCAPSHKSNGLARDRQGRLVICEHAARCVSRLETDGSRSVLAGYFHGKRLNSPNDVAVKSDGAIYFTDPPGGITPQEQEQPAQGVYRLAPDGELALLTDDFERPNGLAFSPDERILYIGDSSPRSHIRAFDVQPDGTLAKGRLFHILPGDKKKGASPDGIKVDRDGRLYCAAQGGIRVFHCDGTHLGTIPVPEQPSNCHWGDSDFQSLFITARSSLYRIRLTSGGVLLEE